MRHLNTADISASYGVLRVRAAVLIDAIMAVLVFVGGANACHHNAETAEQTSAEAPEAAAKISAVLATTDRYMTLC